MPESSKSTIVKKKLKLLPQEPGIYKFIDENKEVIYVGKAKNLKKRVSSYFNKNHFENRKTKVLVSKVWDINITAVETELDALLLENSLIKEFQPKYNINLKDDKSFPLIKITKEPFPKVYAMRNPVKDGSTYFGPYASVKMMKILLDLVKEIYPIRSCNLALNEKSIQAGKFKICLEYQLGNCLGPCAGHQALEEYQTSIKNIKHILRGNLVEVKKHLKESMANAAANWKYEEANKLKDRLSILQNYQNRSTVVNPRITNVDVYNVAENNKYAYVNYLRIANGIIIQSRNFEFKRKMEESKEDCILAAIAEVKNYAMAETEEIMVPFEMPSNYELNFVIPSQGDKKKLLALSLKNATLLMREKTKMYDQVDPQSRIDRILNTMQSDLRLKDQPVHIECFDNSNIQGKYPVSACVVFKNAKPAKKEYRHFNIQTVEGPDDFASMREAISRRYSRLLREEKPLPNLLIVDGGKGQLSSAVQVLKELNIYDKIPVVGIAKRLEEIYYPDDPIPLYIDKKSETLKIIQHMRDEAHRFGITHHRKRRSKGSLQSEITQIKGIGRETSTLLLRTFKSLKGIKEASKQELEDIVGVSRAKIIKDYFGEKETK